MKNFTLQESGFTRKITSFPGGAVSTTSGWKSHLINLSGVVTTAKLDRDTPLTPHAFAYNKVDVYWPRGTLYQTNPSAGGALVTINEGTFDNHIPNLIPENLLPDKTGLYNDVLAKLNEKVRGSLDLSVDAFQIKQTAEMIKLLNPRNLTAYAYRNYNETILKPYRLRFSRLSNRDKRTVKENAIKGAFKIPSDLWLQYQYGWRPLMADIHGLAEEMIRASQSYIQRVEVSAYKPIAGFYRAPNLYFDPSTGKVIDRWVSTNGRRACKIGLSYDCGISDSHKSQFYASLNPVSIAWEIIPYSFVVDWFVNIGQYLRSVETQLINNVAFKGGYVTQLLAYDTHYEIGFNSWKVNAFNQWDGILNQGGQIHYADMNRTVLSSYPFPRLPKFQADLSSGRLLNGAALLAQFLSPGKLSHDRDLQRQISRL